MAEPIDNFFLTLLEPEQSALLFLHQFLVEEMQLQTDRKFNTPFYYFQEKWFGYLNYDPKKRDIYISFVKGNEVMHPKLVSEGRKKMKIYRIVPEKDINTKELREIVVLLKKAYKTT